MIYKPQGWSLGRRGAGSSVESFLAPILTGKSRLYFPFELDSRTTGLGVVCTDRGMQSQFERFRIRNDMEFRYSIRVSDSVGEIRQTNFPSKISVKTNANGFTSLEVLSKEVLPIRRLNEYLQTEINPENVRLYSLEFPDPLKPSMETLTISIPETPPEGYQ